MKWEHTNICTDGGFEGHPRGYGAFPRFLSYFVKGMSLMSLEEAIRACYISCRPTIWGLKIVVK